MTQCFKDQTCDTQLLNQNTIPLSECKTRFVEVYGCMTEVTDVPILTCEGIWRIFQREAEEIVAPGGTLIADPIARNRAINAAYARLWLHDERFQWAGLAAFASKQVGCGLLHASESIKKIDTETAAMEKLAGTLNGPEKLISFDMLESLEKNAADYRAANADNPIPFDLRFEGDEHGQIQQQFKYVYDMMALGNTTLFLDIFPLHAFYKKRGLEELKVCLKKRANIFGCPKFPVLWLVAQDVLVFGKSYAEILSAFEAIEAGNIAGSVRYFALHEQKNILQPTIYEDSQLVWLLRGNHMSYVTNFPTGVAQAIELTLTSECKSVSDGRTIGFNDSVLANLADIKERMIFVLDAAERFDQMLNNSNRSALEQSIREIAVIEPSL